VLYQAGDLMPVDVVGFGLGQWSGDPETFELSYAPLVHGVLVVVDDFVANDCLGRLHRSFLQPGSVSGRVCCLAGSLVRVGPLLVVELTPTRPPCCTGGAAPL
jgi:hypothetical protein